MTKQAIREMIKKIKYRGRCPYCGSRGNIRTRIKKRDRVCRVCGYAGQIEEFGLYIFQTK